MMRYGLLIVLALFSVATLAQEDEYQKKYDAFAKQAKSDYENFRDQANREYADFVRKAWEGYNALPAIPKPKEEEVPPVIIPEEDKKKPIEDHPVPIEDEVVTPPAPQPQPIPIAPIEEKPQPVEKYVYFTAYGTAFKVRFDDGQRFRLPATTGNAAADAWEFLSGPSYNNTIRDCLEFRIDKQLSDWAYLNVLQTMAVACLGESNEATLLMAYIYCQSGYQMRLGLAENKLLLLYSSEYDIYGKQYFEIGGRKYYLFGGSAQSLAVCNVGFPQEKPLSLLVSKEQRFDNDKTKERTLKAQGFPSVKVNVSANKNAINFYNDYPTSMIGDDFMTRWALYANMPMPSNIKNSLYPAFRQQTKGLSQLERVERLLNFTQTSLKYEYDEKVWGCDRAFFPEETLYYPFCDCEDRSIFLSRVVRDVLGLKCILVYYPGHLAMAVKFTENVKGDYIMLGNEKYVICDPTYIGASVGMTMPKMDNKTAKVILLE